MSTNKTLFFASTYLNLKKKLNKIAIKEDKVKAHCRVNESISQHKPRGRS